MTPADARADTGPIYANGCYAARAVDRPKRGDGCVYGDRSGRRVVLFGDSHAAQWFGAMRGAAESAGWRLRPVAKAACPPGGLAVYNAHYQREYTECSRWRAEALELIRAEKPDLVVVSTRAGYYRVMRDGKPRSVAESASRLGDALAADLRMFAEAGARTVLLRDTPVPGFNVPDCLEDRGAKGCTYPLAASLPPDSHQVDAARETSTPVVDLNRELCGGTSTCSTVIDGLITFRDDDHVGSTFSTAQAATLLDALEAAG